MVKSRIRSRKLGGKIFTKFVSFKRKSSAIRTAKSLRSRGSTVRVIKQSGKFPHAVFTSKGRRRR